MKWAKAPDELKILLEEVMKGFECEKRLMFGYPAYFVNSNMFAGLFQDRLFVRLSEDLAQDLKKTYPAISSLEPMPGRPMKEYYVLPQSLIAKPAELSSIVSESLDYARQLPPKVKKPARKKKK